VKFRIKHNHIVSFSGGKDSTAMLFMMLEKGMPVDAVVCADTGYEFPEMYEHIAEVEKRIAPIEIHRVDIEFDYWFDHVRTKGPRKGTRGMGWPNIHQRWCTGQKRDYCVRYIRYHWGIVLTEYIGFTANEEARTRNGIQRKKWDVSFPLIEWGITEEQSLSYCYDMGFDWGGLYEKMSRVSCYLCPLQRNSELKVVHDEYPELWNKIVELDKISERPFKDGLDKLEAGWTR